MPEAQPAELERDEDLNVFGEPLELCSDDPITGFFRDGCCATGAEDRGRHLVCARVTRAFLDFSLSRGNDLVTAHPAFGFPGLKPGDQWCLCVERWKEALDAGVAPPLNLRATHQRALEHVAFDVLKHHALDIN